MKRTKHSLSHYKVASMDMGELVPIALLEVLPGDSIQMATNALVRASPLLAPVMHPVSVSIRHYYVPNRIIWPNFEDFITGGPSGTDTTEHPYKLVNGAPSATGTLADYLGIPAMGAAVTPVNALPFRVYAQIYNDHIRDPDLQPELNIALADGLDSTTNTTLQRVNWEKDYFTGARPWEQKGPAVNVPINTTGSVITMQQMPSGADRNLQMSGVASPPLNLSGAATGSTLGVRFGNQTGLSVNINMLREAFAMQRFEEARARFGSRYVDYLRYLGVQPADSRLQRAEYLGGGTQNIQFSEVLQTAEGTDPVGDLKGHGIGTMRSNRFRRYFDEHGFIMTLMSIRPKSMYTQGIPRFWGKKTKEDYFQKELEHIGQQEIYNWEAWAPNPTTGNGIFGYTNRYEEYRSAFSGIAGEFRDSTLNYWHMARDFASAPALNSAFVTCNPTERTFAVPSQDVMMVYAQHSIQARRIVGSSTKSYVM